MRVIWRWKDYNEHHVSGGERDESGYLKRLAGEAIPLSTRPMALADVFDALTSKRSYRKTSKPEDAVTYLREQANILFDPNIVEILATLPYAEFIQTDKASL